MSQSSVISKIDLLVRRQLIDKHATTRRSDRSCISIANNHYHICSVAEAVAVHECFQGGHGGPGGTFADGEDV